MILDQSLNFQFQIFFVNFFFQVSKPFDFNRHHIYQNVTIELYLSLNTDTDFTVVIRKISSLILNQIHLKPGLILKRQKYNLAFKKRPSHTI